MAIRKNNMVRELDLSRELREVLMKNGMQAHISMNDNGKYNLLVLGHDSPALTYHISPKQAEDMMAWGSTYENKKAYNTFVGIIRHDFDVPRSLVHAYNVNSRVAMGLHGYRFAPGEYGYMGRVGVPLLRPFNRRTIGWGGDFLGWTPRMGYGYHLRRMGGQMAYPNAGVVAQRPGDYRRPGELQSGGYGFYYKGGQREATPEAFEVLDRQDVIKPLEGAKRPEPGQALKYSEHVNDSSDYYFKVDDFQKVLASHGIVIDAEKKTLTLQTSAAKVDYAYTLTDEQLKRLLHERIKKDGGVSVDQRIAIINEVLGDDIKTHITKDMLESADIVNVEVKDEVRQQYEAQFVAQERRIMEQQEQQRQQERLEQARQEERRHLEEENRRIERDLHAVNGRMIRELLGNVAWFTAMAHGRELVVGEIRVDRTQGDHYLMTAEINGQKVAHAISQKDYDRFLALDDAHRLTMFQDVFKKEVSIRHAAPQVYDRDVVTMTRDGAIISNEGMKIEHSRSSHVDGQELDRLKGNKGFYTEIAHGREVEVGRIEVLREDNGKYKMTAVIDGNAVSREITEKQFNKFLAVDDYQRMKLFAKVFDGVDIKTRPGQGTNVGAAILAALVTATDVAHLLNRGAAPPPMTEPTIYASRMEQHAVYAKDNVVSPREVVAAEFEAKMNEGVVVDEGRKAGIGI